MKRNLEKAIKQVCWWHVVLAIILVMLIIYCFLPTISDRMSLDDVDIKEVTEVQFISIGEPPQKKCVMKDGEQIRQLLSFLKSVKTFPFPLSGAGGIIRVNVLLASGDKYRLEVHTNCWFASSVSGDFLVLNGNAAKSLKEFASRCPNSWVDPDV